MSSFGWTVSFVLSLLPFPVGEKLVPLVSPQRVLAVWIFTLSRIMQTTFRLRVEDAAFVAATAFGLWVIVVIVVVDTFQVPVVAAVTFRLS